MEGDSTIDRNHPALDYATAYDEAAAIRECLEYLEERARRSGLLFAGHLIGVAAEAVAQRMDGMEGARPGPETPSGSAETIPFPIANPKERQP
ncbi:MAG: hypothetical protein ACPGNT_06890 [Rhodospirillales bacterium]